MKKRIIYSLLILLVFTACDDKLDLVPYDGLTDEQLFSTDAGFSTAIRGVYSGFRADGMFGENSGLNISPEVLSDNLTYSPQGRGTNRLLFEWRNNPIDQSFGLYRTGYRIISRANRILDNINKIPQSTFRDNIQGEALAIRAMMHFDIARVYCKIPTQSSDANQSLGIHYSKEFAPDKMFRRQGTTVSQVYGFIIDDLLAAYPLINASNPVGRLNKAAVAGMLTRVYLYMGNYPKVLEYADLAVPASGGAVVAPRASFPNVWTDAYSSNVLFKIRITDKDNWRTGVPFSQTAATTGTRSEFVCSYQLFTLFQDTDIRKSASVVTSAFGGKFYNHVKKFMERPNTRATIVDGKYLRAEEVVLSKAEALYRTPGRENDALAALNQIRSNRYSPFVSPNETGAALLDAILIERRLELAFEGDRFFTLKRLAMGLTRTSHGEFSDGTGTAPVVLTYPANGNRWQQPIPKGAIDANPQLAEDQNPGY